MRRVILLLLIFVLPILSKEKPTSSWSLDKYESYISFSVDAKLHDVKGTFKRYSLMSFSFQENKFENLSGEVQIDTASVYTRSKKRDKHLRADDFFYSEKYPVAKTVVNKVYQEEEKWFANVSLTIKEKSKDYVIPVTLYLKDSIFTIKTRIRIDRKDFDLTGNSISNAILDDLVVVKLKLVLNNEER